jgi:hypothetical protein
MIPKQTAKALATADTTARHFRQRGRGEEGVSLALMVAFGQSAAEFGVAVMQHVVTLPHARMCRQQRCAPFG